MSRESAALRETRILLRKDSNGALNRSSIWIVSAIIFVFCIWASYAPLDVIVRAEGRVVSSTSTQIVQNLEGGIVDQVFVNEGDVVDRGQVVVQMSETEFRSAYDELLQQSISLRLRLSRLQAEGSPGEGFHPDETLIELAPNFARLEEELFLARRNEYEQTVENLSEALRLRLEEVSILEPMVDRGAVPRIDLVRVQQAALDAQARLDTFIHEFEVSRAEEMSDVLVQLSQVEQQMRNREDQLERTSVRSPIRGVINSVEISTIGGVVGPGDPLVEIIPLGEDLRIDGRISPRDIGFVFVGMSATVRLTAFDYAIYGTLSGTVVHVGADTVVDQHSRNDNPYYEVIVELDSESLFGPDGEEVLIRPGMLSEVELEAGERSVLSYILKPLFRATDAFSER